MPDRFRMNRDMLSSVIGETGIAVIPAAVEVVRNGSVFHPFRQDSDFFYFTGFSEPDAVAVLVPGHPNGDFHLFVNPRDREKEIWTGYRQGVEGVVQRHEADAAYPISDLDEVLAVLAIGRETVYCNLGGRVDAKIRALLTQARTARDRHGLVGPSRLVDLAPVVSEFRMFKGPAEIESISAACELSAEGHREAMRFTSPGMCEYQVAAAMEFIWREGGSPRNGYPSIVASGENAIILHYVENDRLIEDGDLVLIDAAAEVDMYSADITRTFPANGKFTKPQRALYEVVLAAQRAAFRCAKPGSSIRCSHDVSRAVITEGLVDLGLLPKGVDDSLAMHLYREFFMHGTSHWLGLDVHDIGSYRAPGGHRILKEGMVYTVEPGIYVAADRPEVEFTLWEHDPDEWAERKLREGKAAVEAEKEAKEAAPKVMHSIPEEFLGMGIRIEDDILITADGHEVLSALVPSEPDKIEALCSESSWLHR